MKGALAALTTVLATCASTSELGRNQGSSVLSAPIQRKELQHPPHVRDRLRKRAGTASVSLENEITLYFANVTMGTPEQTLRLHLDTGSSDLWVNSAQSNLCSTGRSCAPFGTYNANASSTYSYVNSGFNISYVDGSGASGDYATDDLNIGSVSLSGFQFGIGYRSTSAEGILGIGYADDEVAVVTSRLGQYANLPVALVNAGIINSAAYSLWLNDLDASTGTVLFGGVDTEKYHGTLSTLPILQTSGAYRDLEIALTGIGVNGNAGSIASSQALVALLDSGSSLTYLPDTIAQDIFDQYNATYDSQMGAATVDCNLADTTDTIDFTFSSPTISVGMDEMVLTASYNSEAGYTCVLGIAPSGGNSAVLGDTFLRSAYVVYDLANNQISLAQTNFNATGSSIEQIGTGASSVPNASAVANAIATATGATSGSYNGGPGASGSGTTSDASLVVPLSLAAVAAGLGAAVIAW